MDLSQYHGDRKHQVSEREVVAALLNKPRIYTNAGEDRTAAYVAVTDTLTIPFDYEAATLTATPITAYRRAQA